MTWITTYSGRRFCFEDLDLEGISLADIAHSLSQQCRFNGHVPRFYSVAQHCVALSDWFMDQGQYLQAKVALLHDTAEAFVSDMPAPLKKLVPQFVEMEHEVERLIYMKYMPIFFSDKETFEMVRHDVWLADKQIVKAEAVMLWGDAAPHWAKDNDFKSPASMRTIAGQKRVRNEFMKRAEYFGLSTYEEAA